MLKNLCVIYLWDIYYSKKRFLISMLGVYLTICSIVLDVSIIKGLQLKVQSNLETIGDAKLIEVSHKAAVTEEEKLTYNKSPGLQANQLEEIQENCKCFEDILISKSIRVPYISSTFGNTRANILAVNKSYYDYFPYPVSFGRSLYKSEFVKGTSVVMIGETVAKRLFKSLQGAIGKEIYINNYNYTVVGVLSKYIDWDPNGRSVILPLNSYLLKFGSPYEKYSKLHIVAYDKNDVNKLIPYLDKKIFLKHRFIRDYQIKENSIVIRNIKDSNKGFFIILYSVGLISFLVGILGLGNLVLSRIVFQIKEIGIHKANGAKDIYIFYQYLFQSIITCILGSVFAVPTSLILIDSLKTIVKFPLIIDYFDIVMIIISVLISSIIISLFPAFKAKSINTIEAIQL